MVGQRQPRRVDVHVTSRELVGLLYCDLSAIVRGRFVRADDAKRALDTGVGWVPANQALTVFGELAPNVFGSIGDLRLRPDPATRVRVQPGDGAEPLHFYLCDAAEPDGSPWDCCPRTLLRDILTDVEQALEARVLASFEHEFVLLDDEPAAAAFSLDAVRRTGHFGGLLLDVLADAGAEPEMFLPEFGPHQFEVPCRPAGGVAAADRSVIVKELVREVARTLGRRATFAADVGADRPGSGTHLHLSLVGPERQPLLYDESRAGDISELGGAFAAGVLEHASALCALCAPSPISYTRLRPGHWAACTVAIGDANRETLLRICSATGPADVDAGTRFNLEFRGLDAAANPYLALAAVLAAGMDGIRRGLTTPPLLDRDPSGMSTEELARFAPQRLPTSLREALDALTTDTGLAAILPDRMLATYTAIKATELTAAERLSDAERRARYARIY